MVNYSEEMTKEEFDEMNKSKRACQGLRDELLECLWASDCVRKEKKTPRECITENRPSVPETCKNLHQAMYECKISMINMRARFRGLKGY